MEREDILVRPDNDVPFAPFSVYLDVSPVTPEPENNDLILFPDELGFFVSDTFRVWELLDDCHNLATAKARLDMYRIDPEFAGQVIKIRANETDWWISDHPVFTKTSTEYMTIINNDSKI